jgi:glutamate:GABA antiporter
MASSDERVMISEQVAPGLLPKVLNSFDMVVIFVAIVLFIVQASVVQGAGGPVAFSYLILGFVFFLIPGALVTAQLGLMFPQEGSLYVWTQKALGPFWGFFAGFCAWWPGVLVMPAIGTLVVAMLQTIFPGHLGVAWQQGLVILAVIWFSAIVSMLRFRLTQNYVNFQFFFYAAAIFVMGLAGVVWLAGGHAAANSFAADRFFKFNSGNWTFFGFVILALLGIEVPLNMGVEVVHPKAIKKYLFWGSIVVMAAYLWATFGNMAVVPQGENNATSGIIQAVDIAFGHGLANIVALVVMWFFITNMCVYNYSFARLLFVSGLERRLPHQMSHLNKQRVPDIAVIVQSVIASLLVIPTFILLKGNDAGTKVYLAFQAAVTVIWCLSMILLFLDVFLVRKWFAAKFEEVRTNSVGLLNISGVVGAVASAIGAYVVFTAPFGPQFTNTEWRIWVGLLTGGSAIVAVLIYAISEVANRRTGPPTVVVPESQTMERESTSPGPPDQMGMT